MSYKCKNCGRSYEEDGLKDLANTFTGKNWLSQKGFCSDKCKREYTSAHEEPKEESSFSTHSYISPQKSAEEIRAEAEVERTEREDKAHKPWLFDELFRSESSISKIVFPDSPNGIERTIDRIISAGIEKVKMVEKESYSEYQQRTMGDQSALRKPYHAEKAFVEICIEKSEDGIKKLQRFNDNTGEQSPELKECKRSLNEFKEKWIPKFELKFEKKKKQQKILIIVIVVANIVLWGGLWLYNGMKKSNATVPIIDTMQVDEADTTYSPE